MLARAIAWMGCTNEALLSVSGEWMLRTERTYDRGRLATETLIVERLPYGRAG